MSIENNAERKLVLQATVYVFFFRFQNKVSRMLPLLVVLYIGIWVLTIGFAIVLYIRAAYKETITENMLLAFLYIGLTAPH